jgi:hypothetical protein
MPKSNLQEENKNSRNCTPKKKDNPTIKSPTPKKPLIKITLQKSHNQNTNNEGNEDKCDKNKNEETSYQFKERILKTDSDGNRITTFNKSMDIQTDKQNESYSAIAPSMNENIETNQLKNQDIDNFTFDDKEGDNDESTKKKKDWISWSLNEKLLFYEAIANGANYSSLQKLFKNMNDV